MTTPEEDARRHLLRVGQDRAGHWLVQQADGLLEGRFVSFATAMAFARAERGAIACSEVVIAAEPLVPVVPFAPLPRCAA